jgi:DNA-binding SARP family transcriptional activator/tetratricopeptide (TPR) repeat protein/tRNA A-37 threonylcarbamoyl transferase component Bud32
MLRLRTLGGLAIERPGASTSGGATSARRRLSILAVLAAAGTRGVPRDKLQTLFWPESDTERARHALDQALHWLRRDLKTDALLLGREELSLNTEVIASDVVEFRAALAHNDFTTAVSLYGGPFLDGVFISDAREFERWLDSERAALAADFERSMEALAAAAAARGDHREAAQWWQRVASLDPRKTRVMMALMSELAASGDRSAALRQAEVYRTLVREDLDVEPNPAVAALVDRLRREPADASPTPGGHSLGTPAATSISAPASARVLGGRYVVEGELGHGTSATVYRGRDLVTERLVAVKVLRPELAEGIGIERFRQEITVTAKLQHPHILPVHDAGETDGTMYFVMPYVEGESLRQRFERAPNHRLPVDEAVRFAIEIADALSYAHRRGIVHRDVKPENVLITSGHAVVCDFGLARALEEASAKRKTGPGTVVGTPAYLSPERAMTGDEGDAWSDQYSVAYVLYESLVGETPFASANLLESIRARSEKTAPPLDQIRPDVPSHVARAVERALSRDPADRFPDLEQFARALTTQLSSQRSWRSRRWPIAAIGAVAIVAVAAAGMTIQRFVSDGDVAARSFVVLADIDNRTSEPVFDHAVNAALTAGLRQSTNVDLFPPQRVQETLTRMGKGRPNSAGAPLGTRLDEAAAREVAQREGLRAILVGAIDRLDTNYLLTERLVDAATGRTLASESVVAKGRGATIEAIDDIVRRLRHDLGESAAILAKHDRPLPQATTRSLDALRKYADGLAASFAGQQQQAKDLFVQAVAIDSDFALVHAELGRQFYYANDRVKGDYHFDRALRLVDRLSDRERLQVQAAAEEWRGTRERAIDLRLALLAQYPADVHQWALIGFDYLRLERPREAIAALRRELAVDSTNTASLANLAEAYESLGDHEQAATSYRRAFSLKPVLLGDSYLNERYGSVLLFGGHLDQARATFDRMRTGDANQRARGERALALLEMSAGRNDTAIAHLHQAVALTHQSGAVLSEARNRLFLAAADDEKGWQDSARMQRRATYDLFRRSYLEPTFLMFLGKALARGGELQHAAEVLDTLRHRARPSNPIDQANAKVLEAEVKLALGSPKTPSLADSARPVALLEEAFTVDSSALVAESLARALAAASDSRAAARYESMLANIPRWYGWEAEPYALAALVQLGRLYETLGDTARARSAYERHVSRMAHGDADLVSVREARAGLSRTVSR